MYLMELLSPAILQKKPLAYTRKFGMAAGTFPSTVISSRAVVCQATVVYPLPTPRDKDKCTAVRSATIRTARQQHDLLRTAPKANTPEQGGASRTSVTTRLSD